MKVEPTGIAGLCMVRLDWQPDECGASLRLFDGESFAAAGLPAACAQTSLSVTAHAGTVRGMHLQRPPHETAMLVRCLRGAVFDVVIDLRPGSPTRLHWRAFTLRAGDNLLVAAPAGCAHGFQSLVDNAELLVQASAPDAPEAADGVRFDDPVFRIPWPLPVAAVTARDRAWPLLAPLPPSQLS